MRFKPYAHTYTYDHAYADCDANTYTDTESDSYAYSDSDPYTHAYANVDRYSQTYPFTKIQSVAKGSSHPRATAVDLAGRRRCSSQAFGHRRDRRRIRG